MPSKKNKNFITNLDKVSIVIPTYSRPFYAMRAIEFWSAYSATVYILDGSGLPLSESFLRKTDDNIKYIHSCGTSLNSRLKAVVNLINTEYVMLCSDDEFMPPSGIRKMVEFLDENMDFNSCCGRSVGFWKFGNKVALLPIKSQHKHHTLDQNDAQDRVFYHMDNFNVTTIYGLHRKMSFLYCLNNSMRHNYSSPYVAETLFEFFSALYGKSKVLPELTWLRSFENEPINSSSFNRKINISTWFDQVPENEIKCFYKDLLTGLEELNQIKSDRLINYLTAINLRIGKDRSERIKYKNTLMTYLKAKLGNIKLLDKLVLTIRKALQLRYLRKAGCLFFLKQQFIYTYSKKYKSISIEEYFRINHSIKITDKKELINILRFVIGFKCN